MKKFISAVALLSFAAAAPASAFLSSSASLSRPGVGRRPCSARGLGRLRAAASTQEADCLVIGGGISGLSTGLLVSKGASVLVADKSAGKPGGVFETRTEDGFIWEEGPNTFQPQDGTLSLASEVGLGDQVVATDPKLPRYVYKGGEVYKLPASGGPPDLSGIAGLLGPLGLIKTVIGALSPVSPSSKADETVADFFRRTVGSEVLDYVVDPFISTVYCGDPSKMSLRSVFPAFANARDEATGLGGLVGGFIASRKAAKAAAAASGLDKIDVSGIPKVKKGSSASFKGGISALPAAIADSLGSKVLLGSEAQSIVHDSSNSLFTTTLSTPSGEVKVESKSVVLAVPPPAAASLLSPMSSKAGESIGKITAPAVHAVTISYPSGAFREDSGCYDEDGGVRGFGVLIPRSEGMGTLGFQFISSLFPERAPKGQTVLLAYYGGAQNPQAASLSADEVVERVHRDAQKILLKDGADAPRVLSVKLWGEGIPQYNTGHKELIREAVGDLPNGLILGGNIDGGVSIGDCVARSRQVAGQALKILGK